MKEYLRQLRFAHALVTIPSLISVSDRITEACAEVFGWKLKD